jgi:hypothetical protein
VVKDGDGVFTNVDSWVSFVSLIDPLT